MAQEQLTLTKPINADEVEAAIKKARDFYTKHPSSKYGHFLILGEKGAGKTSLALTCPKPVYIFSFDPAGTSVAGMPEAVDRGEIIADTRYENDTLVDPHAYIDFERQFNHLGSLKAYSCMGTVIIDSLTTLSNSLLWQIMRKEGRTPPGMSSKMGEGHGMRIQDWGTYLNVFIMLTRSLSALSCHTIMLGHIERGLDGVTGGVIRRLMVHGQSGDQIPINVPEFYTLVAQETPRGLERYLLTQNEGIYTAVTRMGGGGKLSAHEPADIRALLRKAGRPYEDKSPL